MSFLTATSCRLLPLLKNRSDTVVTAGDGRQDPTAVSDEHLLFRIAAADREALGILFQRHYRLVHWIARKILRNGTEAEDLSQDVFLHVARKCHLYNSEKGTARSWIVRTTYYQALNRKEYLEDRHYYTDVDPKGSGVEELAAPSANGYDHSGEAVFGRVRWVQMREVLTEDQWETIRLHFYDGCTFAEIGKKREQTVANVRHHFYRGLARLRKYVFQDELQGC